MKSPRTDWLSFIQPWPRIIGSARVAADWCQPLRAIYDHELLLVRSGTMETMIEGTMLELPQDSYVIVPPGVLHTSSMVAGRGAFHWVHFDWHGCGVADLPLMAIPPAKPRKSLLRHAPAWMPGGILHGSLPSPAAAFALHGRMEQAWNFGRTREKRLCRAWLMELLLQLLDHDQREHGEFMGPPRHGVLLDSVRDELDRLAGMPMRKCPLLGKHLLKFGYSYEHVLRIFQRGTGISPSDYLLEIRLQRARTHLLADEARIEEVAEACGFSSAAYFCRAFKKRHGQSPGAWREACRD